MKTLTGLDETLRSFSGEPIRVTTEIENCPACGHTRERANTWTVGDVLLNILSQSRRQGRDAFALYDAGRAIHAAEGADVRLEDHAFELVREEVENFQGFTLAVIVPVRRALAGALEEEAALADGRAN